MSWVIPCIVCAIGVVILIMLGVMIIPLGRDMYNDACLEEDTAMKVNSILGAVIITLVILGGVVTLSYYGVDICRHPERYNSIEVTK